MAKGVWTEWRKSLLTDADKTRLAVVLRGYAAQLRMREQSLAGTISPLSTLQLCVPSALGTIGGQEDAHGLLGMRTYRPAQLDQEAKGTISRGTGSPVRLRRQV